MVVQPAAREGAERHAHAGQHGRGTQHGAEDAWAERFTRQGGIERHGAAIGGAEDEGHGVEAAELVDGQVGHRSKRLHEQAHHEHRLGATIEDATYVEAEQSFFDDVVAGVDSRRGEIDEVIARKLAEGWSLDRLDRPMRAILRAGTYELLARKDVPVGSVISEYVDVAHAFYDKRESGFVNGLLDAVAKVARSARAE